MSTKRLAADVFGRHVGRGGNIMAAAAVRPCQCFRSYAPPPFAGDAQFALVAIHRHYRQPKAAWYSSSSQQQHRQPNATATSLKKTIRPFLRACHPDAIAAMVDKKHPLSKQAKEINLSAIQTVNGLIDELEELIARCTPPSYKQDRTNFTSGSLPELKSRYEVEFILPFSHRLEADSTEQPDEKDLTRRSVMISFPQELRTNARKWALTIFPTQRKTEFDEPHPQEVEALQTATTLRNHAAHEFVRLLKIAGMDVPTLSVETEHQHLRHKSEDQWTLSDQFLHELGIDPSSEETISNARSQVNAFFGRGQTQTAKGAATGTAPLAYSNPHLQQQRQAFMDSVDFSTFRDKYDQAFLDAQADYTTDKLDLYNSNTPEGRERRGRFVSDICSTARIMRSPVESDSREDDYMDIPEGLDVVHQLVAIRRLSALLYDNFEYLQMEHYGRLWENVTIVLVPPRPDGRKYKSDVFNPDDHQTKKKASKWKRRLRKREKGSRTASRDAMRYIAKTYDERSNNDDDVDDEPLPETGFKFSYGSLSDQSVGHATAYIPIDFGDEELIHMLHRHVHDYFDSVLGTDPVFDYPRYERKETVQTRRRLSASG